MAHFTDAELVQYLTQYFWPFCRIGAFFLVVPIIGTRLVPARIRLMLAFTISAIVAPTVESVPDVSPVSGEGVAIIAKQLLIGLAMGFIVQVLFHICVIGGQLIAMQNGLGFATLIDPVNGINVASISQLYLMSSNLIFLAFNGHLWLIKTLSDSFTALPVGFNTILPDNLYAISQLGGWMFAGGLMVSLPAVTALLLVNIAFGIMAKVAPQMNIFAIGFPFTMVFGLVIIWVTMIGFLPQFQEFTTQAFTYVKEVYLQ